MITAGSVNESELFDEHKRLSDQFTRVADLDKIPASGKPAYIKINCCLYATNSLLHKYSARQVCNG